MVMATGCGVRSLSCPTFWSRQQCTTMLKTVLTSSGAENAICIRCLLFLENQCRSGAGPWGKWISRVSAWRSVKNDQ
jgi:hypothetical protein